MNLGMIDTQIRQARATLEAFALRSDPNIVRISFVAGQLCQLLAMKSDLEEKQKDDKRVERNAEKDAALIRRASEASIGNSGNYASPEAQAAFEARRDKFFGKPGEDAKRAFAQEYLSDPGDYKRDEEQSSRHDGKSAVDRK